MKLGPFLTSSELCPSLQIYLPVFTSPMLGLKAGGKTPDFFFLFFKLEFLGSKSGLYAGKANTSLAEPF